MVTRLKSKPGAAIWKRALSLFTLKEKRKEPDSSGWGQFSAESPKQTGEEGNRNRGSGESACAQSGS